MKELEGIKLGICQMPVAAGRPDLNIRYIQKEILEVKKCGTDIIIFPELCVTGYIIGDMFEREEFISDAFKTCDAALREATKEGITAIVGLPIYDNEFRGEDGRRRLYNSAVIYSDGYYLGHTIKTLQPNYRMFDDDRHFYSLRKLAQENNQSLEEFNNVFPISLKDGRIVKIGLMLCEDMWHDDYFLNPGKILVQNGAGILINISASPWGWQKNRKRHSIVKDLLSECKVPLVYVNNVGLQNNGKNLIVFDGSSTVYNGDGEIIFQVQPYAKGTHLFSFSEKPQVIEQDEQDDSKELYLAVKNAIINFCSSFKKVIIGISGGIDSAVSATAIVDAIGADKVIGIYMPFSKYSLSEDQKRAEEIVKNLGIELRIKSIDKIVEVIAEANDIKEGTLGYENIQARARMEIQASITQREHGIFVCNTNKTEATFCYGTMYADLAGACAFLADMVKREVYQLGDYLNKNAFKKEVIPAECFTVIPSARLNLNQKDPFDYGNLTRRGYHDEMTRAFIEFRLGPEWFLESYINGSLEKELKLEPGIIQRLFPSVRKFLADLEKCWTLYRMSCFKVNQMPPILIVSKRALGYDLRRSMLSPYFTERYKLLKNQVLKNEPQKIVIYGGSFNPPGLHHLQVIYEAVGISDSVFIIPCGPRNDKDSVNKISFEHRRKMVKLAFGNIPKAEIDWCDLESGKFTPTFELEEIYKNIFPNSEIWFVIGGDLISKESNGKSVIQNSWKQGERIWQDFNWLVISRSMMAIPSDSLPPKSIVINPKMIFGSSSSIRKLIAENKDIKNFVSNEIDDYIKKNNLYK